MANKPLDIRCARLNSTGHILKMRIAKFQSDSRFFKIPLFESNLKQLFDYL